MVPKITEHHQKISFRDELIQFLQANGIEDDDQWFALLKPKPDRKGGLSCVAAIKALANARASAWAATRVRQLDDQPFLIVEH
jgi:hypothetical protein